jgi:carboxyl-terminal processing protease
LAFQSEGGRTKIRAFWIAHLRFRELEFPISDLYIDGLSPALYHARMPFSQPLVPRRGISTITAVILASLLSILIGIGIGYGQGVRAITASNHADAGSIFSLGSAESVSGPEDLPSDIDFDLFWNVWSDLKANYYKQPIDDKTLFYGALSGLAKSVGDPYTTFFEPKDAEAFEQDLKGEFSGIGAEIGMKDDAIQVIAPLPDTPAERAGVRAGDYILEIDGEDTSPLSVEEAVMKIRGEKGTTVTLHLGRVKKNANGGEQGEELDIEIVRDTIVVKSAVMEEKGDGIYLIKIRSFNEDVDEVFDKIVDEMIVKDPKGVIIDVRNDPGGYLDRATRVLGEWMPGEDVVLQRKQDEIIARLKGDGEGRLKGIPTVVLINGGSASASEILAGALQDSKNATIIGEASFGKGSVQDYMQYEDGSAVKVTISEWLTPNERSINKEGIKPDIEVEMSYEDSNANRDPQLDKALELLKAGGRS